MALTGKDFDFSGPGNSLYYCDGDAGTTTACGTSSFTIRNYTYHTWLRTTSFKTGGKNVTKIRLWAHDTSATANYGYKGILGLSSTLYSPSDYTSSIPSFTYQGETGTNLYQTYTYNTYYVDLSVNLNPNTNYYMYVGVKSGGAWQAVNYNSSSRYTHYYVEFLESTDVTYTIKYDANGGSGAPSSQTKTWGTNLTLSSTKPTRTGYQFAGWATSATGAVAYAAGGIYSTNSAATLYAVWTANTVKLAYNPNGGTVSASEYGYNDYGWITKNGETYFHVISYGSKANPYNATTFGLTRTGYTFDGKWYLYNKTDGITSTGLDQDTDYDSTQYYSQANKSTTTANATNITCYLYAGWEINSYTATFDANGGSTPSSSTITKNYDTALGTLPTTTRTGYTFNGWYTAKTGGTKISSTTKMGASNITYYAQWTKNSYNYTLGLATGAITTGSTASGSKEYGTTITLKATANTGYTWNKWKSSNTSLVADKTSANTSFTMPAGDLTMTPVVSAGAYTIIFNGNNATGGSMDNLVCTYDTQYTLPANGFTRTGYKFIGWATESDATTVEYADSALVKNLATSGTVTLYAIWDAQSQAFIWHDGKWHRALKYVYTTTGGR